jgi:hypothetical protein
LDGPGDGDRRPERGLGPYLTGVRSQRAQEALEILRGDERLKQAARIAETFGLDPVSLLRDEGDEFLTLVRIAAAQVVDADRKREQEAAKTKGRR